MKILRLFGAVWILAAILHTGCQIFWPNYLNINFHLLFLSISAICLIGIIWSLWDENLVRKLFGNIFFEIILAIILVGIVFLVYTRIIYYNYPNDADWPTRGQFGDMFGGLNVFFASLVFIIAYASWRIQSKEIIEAKKSSEINTKIAALQSYISSFSPNERDEKKDMAQSILHLLTAEYFNDVSYKNLFAPNIEIKKIQTSVKDHIYTPEIKFLNLGYSIKINISTSETINLTDLDLAQNESKLIQFSNIKLDNRSASKKVTIDLKYSSNIVSHEWHEKVVITFTGDSATIDRSGLV